MQMRWKKIGIGIAVCLAIGIVAMSRSAGRDAPEHTPGNAEIQEHTTAHRQPVQTLRTGNRCRHRRRTCMTVRFSYP